MALISKIRDKSWLVLVFVGLALVAFLFSDWGSMFGGAGYEYGQGLVYNEMVDFEKWDEAVQDQREADEINKNIAISQGQEPRPSTTDDVIWSNFVQDIVLEKEYEALGIVVSEAELDAYIFGKDGFQPLPDFKNGFSDSLGNFDENALKARISEMEKDEEQKKNWERFKKDLHERRLEEKYKQVLSQGVYVTDLQAKNQYLAKNEIKSVDFVYQRFNSIDEEEIAVDDAKLKAFFEKNKTDKRYENKKAQRTIKFLAFRFEPSKEDSLEFDTRIEKNKTELATAENDSMYVVKNSETKIFTSVAAYLPDGDQSAIQGLTYPRFMDTVFKNAAIGDVVGPYRNKATMSVAKIMGKTPLMTVRHILISAPRTDSVQVAKANKTVDSLMRVVNKENFEELVTKHSADQGSVANGGKYEKFPVGRMVPEFTKFSQNEPIGKIGYVQTDYGFHIIEVLEREENAAPLLAVITKTLEPSPNTIATIKDDVANMLFDMTEQIGKEADSYKKVVLFDTLMSKKGLTPQVRQVRIEDNKPKIGGLQTEKAELDLLEMAYNEDAKIGDLVGNAIKDKDTYLIGILAGISEKGPGTFEDKKDLVRINYIKSEQAKIILKKFSTAKSLTDVEDPTIGVKVNSGEVTFAAATIGNISNEKKVAGSIFSGLRDGQMTKPIVGEYGVFLIKVNSSSPAEQVANYDDEKTTLLQGKKNVAGSSFVRALVELADVVDNRKFLKKGIRN